MSEITANVKRKALKDLWKTWRAIVEEHVRNMRKASSLEANYSEMRDSSRLLHITV